LIEIEAVFNYALKVFAGDKHFFLRKVLKESGVGIKQ
jgi:hypothetical protein